MNAAKPMSPAQWWLGMLTMITVCWALLLAFAWLFYVLIFWALI